MQVAYLNTLLLLILICCFAWWASKQPAVQAQLPKPQMQYDTVGYTEGTASMMPCIDPATKVYYSSNVTQLQLGRIYVYSTEGGTSIIHRLMYKADGWCYFQGDNNLWMDERINCSRITLLVVGLEYKDWK
jgi:glutamine cyclotransferase